MLVTLLSSVAAAEPESCPTHTYTCEPANTVQSSEPAVEWGIQMQGWLLELQAGSTFNTSYPWREPQPGTSRFLEPALGAAATLYIL